MNKLENKIFHELETIPVVDAHEHLGTEKGHLEENIDFFTLFSHYTRGDLLASGMDLKVLDFLRDPSIPLETRWREFEPHWRNIRYTTYSRSVLITVKKFYGVSDINETTYKIIDKKIKKFYKKGLLDKVLNACNIKAALTQCLLTKLDNKKLFPLMPIIYDMNCGEVIFTPMFQKDIKRNSFEGYMTALDDYLKGLKRAGVVGVKMTALPYGKPDRNKAAKLFPKLSKNPDIVSFEERVEFLSYVVDEAVKIAAKQELVIAVHTGYWGDFRRLHPLPMIPILERHPEAKFDIYHLGYPWIRETLNMVKNAPNAWLNFAWLNIISEHTAREAYDEAIETIPVNKILAFGGDYMVPEKIYGHITITRENIAKVFAQRIKESYFTEKEALKIARMWLYENPISLYNLKI